MKITLKLGALIASATLALGASGASAPAPAPSFDYTVEAEPAWVAPATESSAQVARGGMHYRVIDEQIRVEDKGESIHSHVVRVVDDVGGLTVASQIEVEFDPSYQTLAMHHLEIVRDGHRIDRLSGRKYQVLQRETQLERQVYDGRATLSIVLDDVRVGDQIDFSYTIRGANPVFDGKFVYTAWMSTYRGATALYQVRLLAPVERKIHVRAGSPEIVLSERVIGGLRETLLRREAVPRFEVEANASYAAILPHQAQFSEFADWAAVARWGDRLFVQAGSGDLVERKAAEIRRSAKRDDERLLAALRFVQGEIRYFGTEIGVGTHRPEAPDRVLERRFGDCKDKVSLLVALLRRLGIEARPVLVSTTLDGRVDQLQPSPLAFDHVIARVQLGGATYWLDATRANQKGPLASRQSNSFERGLLLAPDTNALAELPKPYDVERIAVDDTIRIERFTADPVLVSRITYRGDMADGYRNLLATHSLHDVAERLSSAYVKIYPSLQVRTPLRVEDDAGDDAITFVQEFTLPSFWRFPEQRALEGDIVHWAALDALAFPRAERRRDPMSLGNPGVYRQKITVQFPEDVYAQAASDRFEDGDSHVNLKMAWDSDRRRAVYTAEVRIGADQVDPDEWKAFSAKVVQLRPKLSLVAAEPALPMERVDEVNRQLRAAEFSIRTKRIQFASEAQVQAYYRIVSLTARIDAGRLPPELLAQAYGVRGVLHDRTGNSKGASDDFARAVALAPDADGILDAAANHSFRARDLDGAIELAERVLKRHPRDAEALQLRGQARYLKGEANLAEADLSEMLKQGEAVRRGYPMVWLTLAMRQSGHDIGALEGRYPGSLWPNDWPRPLIDLALGKSQAQAVVEMARAQKESSRDLCETYFFIGEAYRLSGDRSHALEYWRKALEAGTPDLPERVAAEFRLEKSGTP